MACTIAMSGTDIEPPQDTPVSNQRDASALMFGVDIDIQKPVDEFPQGLVATVSVTHHIQSHPCLIGSAIFLELKHYKPRKSSISTKCFSLMEMDEIKPGKAVLEMWVEKLHPPIIPS